MTVPSEKVEAFPPSFKVTLLVGFAAYVPTNPVTLFALLRFVVTVSDAELSVEVTERFVAVSEPDPDSLMAKAELAPSCPPIFKAAVPPALIALLIAIAVPAATLLEVSDRFPEKLEAPVVVMVPPSVREKL